MPATVPTDYFPTGVFAAAGPELFRSYTCVGCGQRSATWNGRLWATIPQYGTRLLQRLGELADAELQAERVGPRPDRTAGERDPFLDAPPEALRSLERWRREQEASAAPASVPAPAPAGGVERPAA
jgi:hypothetical protein